MVVNTQFTLFTIVIRVVFFAISVAVLVVFNHLILRLPRNRVSIEQRFIQLLSAVTITFNDQFYFISVIYPNPVSSPHPYSDPSSAPSSSGTSSSSSS
jgi:hypothetical protein